MVRVINIDTKTKTIHIENADKDIQWVTSKGVHIPIKPGETKEQAISEFINKKRGGLKYAGGSNPPMWSKKQKEEKKESQPNKKADVSDIIANYKKKMAALGPKASIRKTDRVEADAIKEFMTRKLGANRPYDEYYQYWLNGMDEKTKDDFNEIYSESEARETAFSELASDVDHSGLASGNPTYEELEQWAKEQKAKKAAAKPAKEIGKPGDNIQYVGDLLKTPKVKELYDRIGKYAKEHASELPLDHLEHLVALRKILLDDNNAAEHVEKNFQKWFGK